MNRIQDIEEELLEEDPECKRRVHGNRDCAKRSFS